ncbi:MAG: hypothetical protein LBL62_03030 [Planctomycetaceae bacterium]|nr:hypothetical protein [Planctomycetaceae bacterium]
MLPSVLESIHQYRVNRRDLSAKGCPPCDRLLLTKISLKYYDSSDFTLMVIVICVSYLGIAC